jgi:hypothetical protein
MYQDLEVSLNVFIHCQHLCWIWLHVFIVFINFKPHQHPVMLDALISLVLRSAPDSLSICHPCLAPEVKHTLVALAFYLG